MSHGVCLVSDAACDLPPTFFQQHRIAILPIRVRCGDYVFTDKRDADETTRFYDKYLANKAIEAESIPLLTQEVIDFLQTDCILDFDAVQVLTISSTRSKIFQSVNNAVRGTRSKFAMAKLQHDIKKSKQKSLTLERPSFEIRVLDSLTLFPGQGVLLHEAARLLESEGVSHDELVTRLETFKGHIRAFLLPDDLSYARKRGAKKGDSSIGLLAYGVATMLDVKPIIECVRGETRVMSKHRGFDVAMKELFDRAKVDIENGLKSNVVVMSYSGSLSEIELSPSFQEFKRFVESKGVEILLSLMGTAAATNVGPGALTLAYAATT